MYPNPNPYHLLMAIRRASAAPTSASAPLPTVLSHPHSGKGARGKDCGKGSNRPRKNSKNETNDELYQRAKAEGKQVLMCSRSGCLALGIEGRQHSMSKAAMKMAGINKPRHKCGSYKRPVP